MRGVSFYTVCMSWAGRRRFIILSILGAVVLAIAAVTIIATLHHTPSCTDGIQNQGEQGVDCGGPCPYLCSANENPPTVLFTALVGNGQGRTDVIAEIENKNTDAAAKNVPYTIALYNASHVLVRDISGSVDLAPGATVPVYLPGVESGTHTVTSAFLSIDPAEVHWYRLASDPRIVPQVSNVVVAATSTAPLITATLDNPSTDLLTQVLAIVLVHDERGNVIAASQTIVPTIPPLGSATATFAWNVPFQGTAITTEVIPVIPLP